MLVAAMFLSDLVWLIPDTLQQSHHTPSWFIAQEWVRASAADVVMALAVLFLFRWIRVALAASALAGLAYAAAMIPVHMGIIAILTPSSTQPGFSVTYSGAPYAFLHSFVAAFFLFGSIAIALPRIRPMWLGLGVGSVAGSLLANLASSLIIFAQFGRKFSVSSLFEMTNIGYALGSGAILAAAFWGGLALVGFRPGDSVAGIAPPIITGRAAEVQKAANFRILRRILRGAGIGSTVFGVIATALGIASLQENGVNAILILLGIFLFAEGVWLLVSPSPAGMIVDGFALIALGCWNIFVTVSNGSSGGPAGFAALGLFQIIWGIQSFARYRRFSSLPMARPDKATSEWLDSILKSAASKDPGGDVVRFQVREKKALRDWRGKLLDDFGLFFDVKAQLIIVAGRDAARITPIGTPVSGQNTPVGISLGGRNWEGEFDFLNWERFNQWKTSAK
jgi:hypothetical protein